VTSPDRRLRILVVEDHQVNVDLLLAILGRCDDPALRQADVAVAATLREARALASTTEHDAVVLDMRLPDGSGLDLIADLQAGAEPPRVLAVTANAAESDRLAAMEAGCTEFLGKPYLPRDLIAALQRVLGMEGPGG
jgi:CheY-like chemotaxis protein